MRSRPRRWTMAGADPAYRFQRLSRQIRSLPGHEAFWHRRGLADDLPAAVDETWPVVYVRPTPFGTSLITLRRVEGELAVEARFVEARALDVSCSSRSGSLRRSSLRLSVRRRPASGFIFPRDQRRWRRRRLSLPPRTAAAVAWGEYRPADQGMSSSPLGRLGVSSIGGGRIRRGARPRGDLGRRRPAMVLLLDDLNVRYAPSATVCAAARLRAQHAVQQPRLVLLADPTSDLSAARAEAERDPSAFPPRIEWTSPSRHAADRASP